MTGFSVEPGGSKPVVSWAGDRFLRIEFGGMDDETLHRVHAAHRRLIEARVQGVVDITPAYTTLLVTFDVLQMPADVEQAVLTALRSNTAVAGDLVDRVVEVPVCYGGEFGPDLGELAALHGLTAADAISHHAGADFTAAFIGFTPGFAYLRGLPERLATPRLLSPRPRVPAGSVGIAGSQTGVYPGGAPGGWRLIGRTPVRVFDAARRPASLLGAGDRVRFVPISITDFDRIAAAQNSEGR